MDCANKHYYSAPFNLTNFKSDDQLFIDAWLSKIGKLNLVTVAKTQPKKLEISSVRVALNKCLGIIKKLEATRCDLQENVATMRSADWKAKTVEIGLLRDELSVLMLQFQNRAVFKLAINKRAKKRMNQKRRRADLSEKRAAEREVIREQHKRIDDWLEQMKDNVERAKAEESMKKDADCVLSEVTKKKSDVRKQLSLIRALVKLREVREQVAVQHGEKLSAEDCSAFNKTMEKLIDMWENSLKTYTKEEQGLKIMLEASNDCKKFSGGKEKQISQAWESILFNQAGLPNNPLYWGLTSAERDVETFIAIRKSWDTFLSDSSEGTKIPIGWVLPASPKPDSGWNRYLQAP